jgi:ferredoxin-NADP reductase
VPGSAPASIPDPVVGSSSGPLTATLEKRALIAPGIADLTFAMRNPAWLKFQAGQFVSIGVPPEQAAAVAAATPGASVRRSYSIASPSAQGDQLRFIIRVIPEGAASEFLMLLPMGAEVRMTGPHGFFVLDPDHAGDVVFGATGTGVAAVMPMLPELARRPPRGRRLLYWGVRHEDDFFARGEIEALCREAGCELVLFLSDPQADWTGARGRITPALLDELPRLASPTFYLVGNGAMISELKRELVARGINRKKQIRTEAFFD